MNDEYGVKLARIDFKALEKRYLSIKKKIEKASQLASRKSESKVVLVIASKTQPPEAIEALYKLGHRDFGENYVQELFKKAQVLNERGCQKIRWHFIGHLQTNKVKILLSLPQKLEAIHTIDSEKLIKELDRRLSAIDEKRKALTAFIEVNLGNEASKTGVSQTKARKLAELLEHTETLRAAGLMCIPPAEKKPEPWFTQLRKLELECRPFTHGGLSMGMSQDFETAIELGATHVRVGTSIFGPRNRPPSS